MDDNNKLINIHSFVDYWMEQLSSNEKYKDLPTEDITRIQNNSKDFLTFFLRSSPSLKNMDTTAIRPLLELLRMIRQQHDQKGLSTRDTTLLILSLKSSLTEYLQNNDENNELYKEINELLDAFGLLSFELYSNEQEKIVGKQAEQIKFLQTTESKAFGTLIGNSTAMQIVYQAIGLVLENDVTVLLQGESGTGKDIIANVIHSNSTRKTKPFIAVNCGAIPENLIESELFGHEAGAFTGATSRRIGKFELADNGTIFLDEISELSIEHQTRLLRVLQNQTIERIGGNQTIPVNVRVIAASNKSLEKLVDQNKFRLDLYYRINIFPIHIPNLSRRESDVILLADHFISKHSLKLKIKEAKLTNSAIEFLETHEWKGNVRELENMIQRSLIIANGKAITKEILSFTPGQQLPPLLTDGTSSSTKSTIFIPQSLEEHERELIIKTLDFTNNNIKRTAEILKISRTTLYNKCEKYKIPIH